MTSMIGQSAIFLGLLKTVGGVKNQIMSLFRTKDYSKPKCVKTD